jgi:hypothetical protein
MDPTVTGALIGAGASVIVALAGFASNVRNSSSANAVSQRALEAAQRTIELSGQGQVTDRYSKGIELLGSPGIDLRIGGIYALERIAADSSRDHSTIMEVLAGFVREHSHEQWPPPTGDEPGTGAASRGTRPDVQVAATVIARRDPRWDRLPVNLQDANLVGVTLNDAHLGGARLEGANLRYANLMGANLAGANLGEADLHEAVLERADLHGALLDNATLTYATIKEANLKGARLYHADLTGADLTGADLTRANLTEARWPSDTPVPPGWRLDAGSGLLQRAAGDPGDAAAE